MQTVVHSLLALDKNHISFRFQRVLLCLLKDLFENILLFLLLRQKHYQLANQEVKVKVGQQQCTYQNQLKVFKNNRECQAKQYGVEG